MQYLLILHQPDTDAPNYSPDQEGLFFHIGSHSTASDAIEAMRLHHHGCTVVRSIVMQFATTAERERELPHGWQKDLKSMIKPVMRDHGTWSMVIAEGVSTYGTKGKASSGKGKSLTVEQEVEAEIAKTAGSQAPAKQARQTTTVGTLVLKQTYAQKRALAIKFYLKRQAKQARRISKQARKEAVR